MQDRKKNIKDPQKKYRLGTVSKIYFTGGLKLQFHMKTPYNKLDTIYTNCCCHWTQMATIPIYTGQK